eukprot:TRINITY_DN468_c3_g2_i5.p1 TRINITY_DN468_c3_g2~~TRINITY_DN468_c3_g2_i5.p1  ORF type:complete len:452 (+),score=100.72 TRINITY_DN468_c3_g2_i5:260-1615(+)
MSSDGGYSNSGHVELLNAANNLQSCGPGGAVTVSSSPLYDAVMALFRFSKEQAVKQADEVTEVRRELGSLRSVIERQQERIRDLEQNAASHHNTGNTTNPQIEQKLANISETLDRQHEKTRELEANQRSTNADLDEIQANVSRKFSKVQNDAQDLHEELATLAAKTKQDMTRLSDNGDTLRAQVVSQMREVATSISRIESQSAGRFADLEDKVKALQNTPPPVVHQTPAPPPQQPVPIVMQQQPSVDEPMLKEAFTLLKDRLEDLEETRDEQSKAALVITQYFDKLDHLYSLMELDKRAAAYGASASREEKLNLLMTLPVFDELLRQIHAVQPRPVARESISQDYRGVSPTRPSGSVNVVSAGVELKDRNDSYGGATVVTITPGGPASEAGWKVGDHVVGVQGTPLRSARDFSALASTQNTVPVTRIPAGHYRPVSGTVTFNGAQAERSFH